MRVFSPPSDYVSLYEAPNELMLKMHQGMSPSKQVVRSRHDKIDAWNPTWQMSAKQALHQAIISGVITVYAEFASEGLRALTPEIWQAGIRRKGQGLPTLAYIDRHVMAPFGLPWTVAKELRQAPLFLNKQAFRTWLRKEMRKKAWPCHAIGANSEKPRGRPRKRDDIIKVLEELDETGELKPSMKIKQIHALVQKHLSAVLKFSEETTRRACHEIGFEFAGSRLSHR
jgi:hypothetical protein